MALMRDRRPQNPGRWTARDSDRRHAERFHLSAQRRSLGTGDDRRRLAGRRVRLLGVARRNAGVGDGRMSQSALDSWFADAARADPKRFRGRRFRVEPLARMAADRTTRGTLGSMLAAVVMVLLVSCANAANLLLTRTLGPLAGTRRTRRARCKPAPADRAIARGKPIADACRDRDRVGSRAPASPGSRR